MKKYFYRLISLALIVLTLISVTAIFPNRISAKTEGQYKYNSYGNYTILYGNDTSLSGNIVLPASIGGFAVTDIGYEAFIGYTSLTGVKIPDSVTEIAYKAFANCTSLADIDIPDSVKSIAENAFENTALYNNNANWTDNALYIDNHLIRVESSVSGDFTVREGTKSIAACAFESCKSLESVTLPDGLISIGYSAFYSCPSLISINIPGSVTAIGDNAFTGCTSISDITIADGASGFDRYTFEYTEYYNNKSNWADDVLYIDNYLITSDRFLISGDYTVKDETKVILGDAFYGSSITSITLPEGLIRIGSYAFGNCTFLKSVEVPKSVSELPDNIFKDCTSLEKLTIYANTVSIDRYIFGDTTNFSHYFPNLKIYTSVNSAANKFALSNNIPVELIACTHPESRWFSDIFASENKAGQRVRKCSLCNEILETDAIPKLDEWVNPFGDVASTQWFYGAVRWANGNGIINGINPSEFAPDSKTTRGMLVTLLGRLEGVANDAFPEEMRFWDTGRTSWYSAHIAWAADKGIVNGYPDGSFMPDKTLTRQEMAAMLANYAKLIDGIDITANLDEAKFNSFSDSDNVASWAKPSMLWAVSAGLMNGSWDVYGSLCLNPESTATRAEIAQMMYNYCLR